MSGNEYLNSSITASSIDAVDTVNLPNLSSQLNSINNLGSITTTSVPWDYYDYGEACSISISDELKDRSHLEKKINEVLDDVLDFCDNYCVLKCEDICDGEAKSQCPLWNRLKCEKRV